MLYKFLENKGFCKAGEVHKIPAEAAKSLLERKVVEPYEETKTSKKSTKVTKSDGGK